MYEPILAVADLGPPRIPRTRVHVNCLGKPNSTLKAACTPMPPHTPWQGPPWLWTSRPSRMSTTIMCTWGYQVLTHLPSTWIKPSSCHRSERIKKHLSTKVSQCLLVLGCLIPWWKKSNPQMIMGCPCGPGGGIVTTSWHSPLQ